MLNSRVHVVVHCLYVPWVRFVTIRYRENTKIWRSLVSLVQNTTFRYFSFLQPYSIIGIDVQCSHLLMYYGNYVNQWTHFSHSSDRGIGYYLDVVPVMCTVEWEFREKNDMESKCDFIAEVQALGYFCDSFLNLPIFCENCQPRWGNVSSFNRPAEMRGYTVPIQRDSYFAWNT